MQLRLYLRMLQRGWWIVAITALAALIIALVASYRTPLVYRTSARFIISPNPDQAAGGRDLVNALAGLDKRSIASTFAEVLDSTSVYQAASAELQIDASQLRTYDISTVVLPDANILEMSVSGSDPHVATLLANNVGRKGIDYMSKLYPVYSLDVLDTAVLPSSPISPNPRRDASLALLLGAVLGVALVLVREQLRAPLIALRQRTSTDSVSSAYTRSYLLSRLEMFAQQDRGEAALGVIQFDGLRDLAGTLPKPVIQRLLRRVTTTFRDELRGSDLVGRWNDTGFAVVLPMTTGSVAMKTLERICQILSRPIDLDQSGETLALSPRVGIIEYRGSEPIAVLIERAEAALEQSRKNGNKATFVSMDMQAVSA